MNRIWVFLILFCLLYGLLRGRSEEMIRNLLEVPNKTVSALLKIGGPVIFYAGLLEIASASGLIKRLAERFSFIINKLFPTLSAPAREHVAHALVANLLGLGAAGTPSVIKALKLMRREKKEEPSPEMARFLLLNVACFTVFPVTVLSVRKIFFAKINMELLPFFILASFFLSIVALLISKIPERKNVS